MALKAPIAVVFSACFLLPILASADWADYGWEETEKEKWERLHQLDRGTHEEAYIVTVNNVNFQPGDSLVLRNLNGTEITSFKSYVEPRVGNTYFHSSNKYDTFCWVAGKDHEINCSHNHTATDNSSIKSTFGRAHAASPFLRVWGDHILSNNPEGHDVFKFQTYYRNTTDIIRLDLKSVGVDSRNPFDVDVHYRLAAYCSVKEKAIKISSLDPGSVSYGSISYADVEGDCSEIAFEPVFQKVYFFQGRFLRVLDIPVPGLGHKITTIAEIPYPYFKSLSCVYRTCAWVGGLERHGEFVGETDRFYSYNEDEPQTIWNITKVYAAQPGFTILQVQRIEDLVIHRVDYCGHCPLFCFLRTPWSHGTEFPGWMNCYCPTSGRSVGEKCRVMYSDSPPEHQRAESASACHQGWVIAILVVAIIAGVALMSYYVVIKKREQRNGDEPLVDRFSWNRS